MKVFALVLLLLGAAAGAQANGYALIVNGDVIDHCHIHETNTRLAGAALQSHGYTVTVAHSRREIYQAVKDLRGKLTSQDILLVYTTGHGLADRLYLEEGTISKNTFVSLFAKLPYGQLMAISDQCYSGAFKDAFLKLPRARAISSTDAYHVVRCELFARTFWRNFPASKEAP